MTTHKTPSIFVLAGFSERQVFAPYHIVLQMILPQLELTFLFLQLSHVLFGILLPPADADPDADVVSLGMVVSAPFGVQ